MLHMKKGEDMLAVTNPAFLILLLPLIKFVKKNRYILLVHDVFPENVVAINKMSSKSVLYRSLKFFYDKAYARADICISIGRDMSEIICKKIKNTSTIRLITNWADDKDVFPLQKEQTEIYQELNLNSKFVFQFAGNLGHAQGLDNILSAINLLDLDELHFLFIGGGAKYKEIEEFERNSSMKNISLRGFVDRSMQNDFLNACDVALVTLNDGMYGLGVPSKSYNIMAAGKPILLVADKKSEIARCIEEYNIGWVVEPNCPKALKQAFEKACNEKESFESMKNNARKIAEDVFAKELILEKYYQLLK